MKRLEIHEHSRVNLLKLTYAPARLIYRLQGWRVYGEPPDIRKYVLIGVPHTSNWDFAYMLGVLGQFALRVKWMAKDSLFFWPLAGLHRTVGGISVDRSQARNMVDTMVEAFNRSEELVLVVPPEGTRGKRDYWKSGFYYIALGANIPIILGFLDYEHKIAGFGPTLYPTGDIEADLAKVREFYADKKGKFPDNMGEIRFRQRPKN